MAHGPSCSAACGIFPSQGSNPCPLHWQADSQPLRHQGSPVTEIFVWNTRPLFFSPKSLHLASVLLFPVVKDSPHRKEICVCFSLSVSDHKSRPREPIRYCLLCSTAEHQSQSQGDREDGGSGLFRLWRIAGMQGWLRWLVDQHGSQSLECSGVLTVWGKPTIAIHSA